MIGSTVASMMVFGSDFADGWGKLYSEDICHIPNAIKQLRARDVERDIGER